MMYWLLKNVQIKRFSKGLFVLLLMGMQSACSHMPKTAQNSTMAATIYTELAQHYWQNGYQNIARERLLLALQQDPTYGPALLLQKQWQ